MARRRRPAERPGLEVLDARDLPSVVPMLATAQLGTQAMARAALAGPTVQIDTAGAAGGGGGAGAGQGGGTGAFSITSTSIPTPREAARDHFTATANGPMIVGPPRFIDQSKQIYVLGRASSNFFYRGVVQLALYLPADPVHGQVTGTASLYSLSVSQSGSILALNLTGSPSDVDRFGRPTHLTWQVSSNSGGTFSGANSDLNLAGPAGTLDIRYRGNVALLDFQGTVQTSGTTNILRFPSSHQTYM